MEIVRNLENKIQKDFEEFKDEVLNEKSNFVKKITESLYNGDFYLLKH